MRGNLLYVEDDSSLREIMAFNLEEAGYDVDIAKNGKEGFALYDASKHDLVLSDIKMPTRDGIWLLRKILEVNPNARVLMLTAFGGTDRALEAMRAGAFHYVEKPVNLLTLIGLLDRSIIKEKTSSLKKNKDIQLIAASSAMNYVLRKVDKIAKSDASILLRGESGTGKELVAQTIHQRSLRASSPFVAVNCAAIPADLLESILFGHKKGAFTGANSDSDGKFVAANGGTIFLDEIGEMSPSLQSKLLRVLQDGEIDVVGSSRSRHVDVRVISATHQNLEEQIQKKKFRSDLFYRLNVVPIIVPPLRERPEDIPVLFHHFVRKFTNEDVVIEPEVEDWAIRYPWPGNVRELSNVVQRLVLLRNGNRIDALDLPLLEGESAHKGLPFQLPEDTFDLIAFEKSLLREVMKKMSGNQSAAARYLCIPRHVLIYRLEKYGI